MSLFLDNRFYTLNSGLRYGIAHEHWRKSRKGDCLQRVIHGVLAVIEFIPLFGWIPSLVEYSLSQLRGRVSPIPPAVAERVKQHSPRLMEPPPPPPPALEIPLDPPEAPPASPLAQAPIASPDVPPPPIEPLTPPPAPLPVLQTPLALPSAPPPELSVQVSSVPQKSPPPPTEPPSPPPAPSPPAPRRVETLPPHIYAARAVVEFAYILGGTPSLVVTSFAQLRERMSATPPPPVPAPMKPSEPAEKSSALPAPFQSLKTLVHSFDSCWNATTKKYVGIVFDIKRITELFTLHNERFKPSHNPEKDYGFLLAMVVPRKTKVFVRADLHGDLKSALENLKTLQEQGLLDANFRCHPNVHIVFLGDYADRGTNTMQILELLATLRLENPDQVTLIRGNHEDLTINCAYCGQDPDFRSYLFEENGYTSHEPRQELLNKFYQTMPLTLYLGETNDQGERQYVQFTHGLFELYIDPIEILNDSRALATMVVSKTRQMGSRINSLQIDDKADYESQLRNATNKSERKRIKQLLAAQKIKALWAEDSARGEPQECTIFNWGDIKPHSFMGDPGSRYWSLTATDVKHFLRFCSPFHKVKLVLRGHQHKMQHYKHENKVVVSTLPVGMDSAGYAYQYTGQLDTAYLLTTSKEVRAWTKQAYQRKAGETDVQITAPVPIRSEQF